MGGNINVSLSPRGIRRGISCYFPLYQRRMVQNLSTGPFVTYYGSLRGSLSLGATQQKVAQEKLMRTQVDQKTAEKGTAAKNRQQQKSRQLGRCKESLREEEFRQL
ncbi:hypothetical protein NC652_028882 [Populus alba x Populus x berolinensis]|nr:hypothetical protein NC652_028882 [Populus alba x Populus x berolinensis]